MKGLQAMGTLLCILWLPCLAFGQQEADTLTRRELEEVLVKDWKRSGNNHISRKDIMRVPSLLGEYDLVKYLATLPGVFSVNALDPGIYVRGGNSSENAFWVNDMEVMNPNHLTGIISTFDSYVLGNSTFYKSGFPARYNNYLAAYLNMAPMKGDMEKYHGEVSVGLLSSALKLQGPLKKNHTSFIVSGRMSYLQHIARLYNKANDSESMPKYGFSDVTLGITSKLSSRWNLSVFGLYTADHLQIELKESRINHDLAWNTFSSNIKAWYVGERGDLSLGGGVTGNMAEGKSDVHMSIKTTNRYRTWNLYSRYHHEFGGGWHGEIGGRLTSSLFDLDDQGRTDFNIYQIYGSLEYDLSRWNFSAGLNYQYHQGNANVGSWSPRLKVNYLVNGWNIWGDYAMTVQYESLYPYFTLRSPGDMRYPLERGMKPEECHHVSLGGDRKIGENLYVYMALFFKRMSHLKDFLAGVRMNQESLADLLVEGKGEAKGVEVDLIFEKGFFYGRANYTLSESTRKFEDINMGKTFHSPFDMRHRLLLNFSFKLAAAWSTNVVWTYCSGGYATFPVSVAFAQDIMSGKGESKFIPIYRDRYNFRLPDNHRLDVSLDYCRYRKNHVSCWSMGVYNLYNQQNPTFIYFEPRAKDKYYTQFVPHSKALLPFIPYISFTLKW